MCVLHGYNSQWGAFLGPCTVLTSGNKIYAWPTKTSGRWNKLTLVLPLKICVRDQAGVGALVEVCAVLETVLGLFFRQTPWVQVPAGPPLGVSSPTQTFCSPLHAHSHAKQTLYRGYFTSAPINQTYNNPHRCSLTFQRMWPACSQKKAKLKNTYSVTSREKDHLNRMK